MGKVACAALSVLLLLPRAASAEGHRTYVLDPDRSTVTIRVGRSGLFGFLGHNHVVVAPRLRGEVLAEAAELAASSVWLSFEAAALRVTGEGEPKEDVPKVQEAMVGPQVLDVARFPEVAFRSRKVEGRAQSPGHYDLQVTGELYLHGATRSLMLPVRVELEGDSLTATGRAKLRQMDFGIEPLSVGGVVNVKDEVTIEYRLVARETP